ncbi:hypothetical protein [Paucibacter sp. XJ19-41]|uniref:hypothetical protein n=1 Tax=Paucibacter sp. XJ19-41 TaxID=2927824 RepID=UPI00234B52BF|nr:hypothetical protein [Paucibacter sp. XJ19-41]MDC6170935.1 hypothetical protein [Paucibacter sp. XJ19-41]
MQIPVVHSPQRASEALQRSGANSTGIALDALPALRRVAPQDLAPSSAATPATSSSAGRYRTSPFREPGQQQRLGELQQGLAYAERLGQALQELKSGLSRALAQPQLASRQALPAKLEAVQQAWQARAGESGGQLDARLQPVAEGEQPRQLFRVRGLDVQALSSAGAETLRLAMPGQPRATLVPLDGQGLQRGLQSLQRALAATDMRPHSQGGELLFSAPESQWPALRDGLSLRGDGKRFPSGQMVRALLDPQPDAISPSGWKLDDSQAQRHSLVQVLDAQGKLDRAQQQLSQRLDNAAALTGQADTTTGSAGSAAQQARFAAGFRAEASEQALDFERLSALAPALLGLHRNQVQQLLLPPGGL